MPKRKAHEVVTPSPSPNKRRRGTPLETRESPRAVINAHRNVKTYAKRPRSSPRTTSQISCTPSVDSSRELSDDDAQSTRATSPSVQSTASTRIRRPTAKALAQQEDAMDIDESPPRKPRNTPKKSQLQTLTKSTPVATRSSARKSKVVVAIKAAPKSTASKAKPKPKEPSPDPIELNAEEQAVATPSKRKGRKPVSALEGSDTNPIETPKSKTKAKKAKASAPKSPEPPSRQPSPNREEELKSARKGKARAIEEDPTSAPQSEDDAATSRATSPADYNEDVELPDPIFVNVDPIDGQASTYSNQLLLKLLETVMSQTTSGLHGIPCPLPSDAESELQLSDIPCWKGLELVERNMRKLIQRSIRNGEGNCCILVGEKGSGKTAIIKRALACMDCLYGKDSYIAVKLSGLIHSTDRLALIEIAKELCSDVGGIDDDGSSFTTTASTMATLLSILEPPPAAAETSTPQENNQSKPIIFILDEFDLFAKEGLRQSFLYCLLDLVQGSRRAGGMAVIGCSARADCLDSLEKRVKSRCQSRIVHVTPSDDIGDTLYNAKAVLKCENQSLSSLLEAQGSEEQIDKIVNDWNNHIDAFFASDEVLDTLQQMRWFKGLHSSRTLFSSLHQLLMTAYSQVKRRFTFPCLSTLKFAAYAQFPERNIPLSLTMPEVAVLIAAKHLTFEISSEDPLASKFTFNQIWQKYYAHISKASASQKTREKPHDRGLMLMAFENLLALNLLIPAQQTSARARAKLAGRLNLQPVRLVPWPITIDRAVRTRSKIPEHLKAWSRRDTHVEQ